MKAKAKSMFYILLALFHVALSSGSHIFFEVMEEQPAPILLGNIATAAGIASTLGLEFSLLSRKEMFYVDESSGDFQTVVSLDREKLCGSVPKCIVIASIAVSSAPEFFQRYLVNVVVRDVNDQKPRFSMESFPKALSERADIYTSIRLPLAYDEDFEPAFKVQNYYLEPHSQKTFGLDVYHHNKTDGSVEFEIHLRLLQKIDREDVDTYTMTLVASDRGGNEGRLLVIISVTDENDNEPKFQEMEYNVTLQEITRVGTTVLNVSARDSDDGENGRVGYSFSNDVDRKILEFFEIDRGSGDVLLLKSLEKEGGMVFVFKVRAFDHGTPTMSAEANVRVAVEDTVNNPPSISVSLLRSKGDSILVSEDVAVGTKVALVDVVDTDSGENGEILCSATSEFFSLDEYSSSGEYTISVARDLDREKDDFHSILIQCTDQGTPPLSSTISISVIVADVNDNGPIFTKETYEFKLVENSDVGLFVGAALAVDSDEEPNSIISYKLESGVSVFIINASNGYLYTSVADFDREVKDKYVFEVYAVDKGISSLTATTTVTVNIEDLNDEHPSFESPTYKFNVHENAENNSIIGHVQATDPDLNLGGVVEYFLMHNPLHPDPPFSLSKRDGTLILTHPLDFETINAYNFTILATDLGKPQRNSSIDLEIFILDANDNDPVIIFPNKDNLSVTLNLNFNPGHEVIRVIAHDVDSGDNGRLTYSFVASHNLFWINEDTGAISLSAEITEKDVKTYNVTISVHDHGIPPRRTHAVLQIDIVQQNTGTNLPKQFSYTIIVIIMVSLTLFISFIVLITFCIIKFVDNRKISTDKNAHNSIFESKNKTEENYLNIGENINDIEKNNFIIDSSTQKQIFPLSNQCSPSCIRSSKKSVTFESTDKSFHSFKEASSKKINAEFKNNLSTTSLHKSVSPTVYGSYFPSTLSALNYNKNRNHDSAFNSPLLSTFFTPSISSANSPGVIAPNIDLLHRPGGLSPNHGQQRQDAKLQDQMIDAALQKHKALVKHIMACERTDLHGHKIVCPETGSSSSGETGDSGHGGSVQDVFVSKMDV